MCVPPIPMLRCQEAGPPGGEPVRGWPHGSIGVLRSSGQHSLPLLPGGHSEKALSACQDEAPEPAGPAPHLWAVRVARVDRDGEGCHTCSNEGIQGLQTTDRVHGGRSGPRRRGTDAVGQTEAAECAFGHRLGQPSICGQAAGSQPSFQTRRPRASHRALSCLFLTLPHRFFQKCIPP